MTLIIVLRAEVQDHFAVSTTVSLSNVRFSEDFGQILAFLGSNDPKGSYMSCQVKSEVIFEISDIDLGGVHVVYFLRTSLF